MKLVHAKELYNSGFANMALDYYSKDELVREILPSAWEDLGQIEGYALVNGKAEEVSCNIIELIAVDVCHTADQAMALRALTKLTQVMPKYNKNWVPKWDGKTSYYCIEFLKDKMYLGTTSKVSHFLIFSDKDIAKMFMERFKDLIALARPFL